MGEQLLNDPGPRSGKAGSGSTRGGRSALGGPFPASSPDSFRLLVESSTDMLSRATPDAIYLYVSPASERIFGWKPEELVGRRTYDFFHPDDLAALQSAHGAAMEAP